MAELNKKDEFVQQCLDLKHLPKVPPYWPRMRKMNTEGPTVLGMMPEPEALSPDEFEGKQQEGALVLDCRQPEAFGVHIPGALNVGMGSSFPTWAGTVLPPDTPLVLVLDNPNDLWKVTWELLRVGYDPPTGWLAGGMFAWRTAAKPLTILPQYTVWDLNDQIHKDPTLQVLDVRQPGEWDAGHIGKAAFISGSELPHRFEEIDRKRPVAVVCGSGYRSSVSASLLQHHGHQQVFNVIGGMSAWKTADLPLEKG